MSDNFKKKYKLSLSYNDIVILKDAMTKHCKKLGDFYPWYEEGSYDLRKEISDLFWDLTNTSPASI